MQRPHRIDWVDTAKGLSIILVTLYHTVLISDAAGISVAALVKLNNYLAPVRMPLFFAAAGLFAGKSIRSGWPELFRTKIALYGWLILVWTTIRWLTMTFLVDNPANIEEGGEVAEILRAFYAPETGIWFLWSLAIFFIAAKLLSYLPKQVSITLVVAVSILAITAIDRQHSAAASSVFSNLAHKNTLFYFPFFFIAAVRQDIFIAIGNRSLLFAALFAAACVVLFLAGLHVRIPPVDGACRFLSSACGVSAMLIFSRYLQQSGYGNGFSYLGKNTLPIYVGQVPVICLVLAAVEWFGIGLAGPMTYLFVLLLTAATIVMTLAVERLLIACHAAWFYRLPFKPVRQRVPA